MPRDTSPLIVGDFWLDKRTSAYYCYRKYVRFLKGELIDRIAAEWVRLERERRDVTAKLRRAEAREAND